MKKCFISPTRLILPFYFLLSFFYLPFAALCMGNIGVFWLLFGIFMPIGLILFFIKLLAPTIVFDTYGIKSLFKSDDQKRFKINKNNIKRIFLANEAELEITDARSIGNIKKYIILIETKDDNRHKIILANFTYKQIKNMFDAICFFNTNNEIVKLFPSFSCKSLPNIFSPNNVFYNRFARTINCIGIIKIFFSICIPVITLGTIIVIGAQMPILLIFFYGAPLLLTGFLLIWMNFIMLDAKKFVFFKNYLFFDSMQKTFKDEIIFDLKEGNINLLEVEKISINYINSVYDGITWKKRIVLKVADFHFDDGSVKRLPIGLLSTKNQKRLIKYLSLVKPIKIENNDYIDKNNFHSDDSTTL